MSCLHLLLMLWRAFSSAYPWGKLRLSWTVSQGNGQGFWKESREQKDMPSVYTVVLLTECVTPLWMYDFLKILILKSYLYSIRHLLSRVLHIPIEFLVLSSLVMSTLNSLHCSFVYLNGRLSAGTTSVVTMYDVSEMVRIQVSMYQ